MTIYSALILLFCLYPVIGAGAWFAGSLCYAFLKKDKEDTWQILKINEQPLISILIAAHNEDKVIKKTIEYLVNDLNYSNYEILVIDDASTDKTPEILADLQGKYSFLRVIKVRKNMGKAHALNIGMCFAKSQYILSNDADTIPEPDSLMKYANIVVKEKNMNISAITANMDVQNRDTLLGKSQVIEFSSIVGVIKRSQSAINNSLYAYSGASTLYKKSFLIAVGGLRQNRATEDISVAWDHQQIGGIPTFSPDISFHMNVPENIKDLYKQRKRWAKGGIEVWASNTKDFIMHPVKNRYYWTMYFDATISILWSIFFVISTIAYSLAFLYFIIKGDYQNIMNTFAISCVFVCFEFLIGMLQIIAGVILDKQQDKIKYLLFAPLYILLFWMINPISIVATFIPGITNIMQKQGSGTWESPLRKY